MGISRAALAVIAGLGMTSTVAPVIYSAYAATTYIDRAPAGQLMGAEYWDQTVYGLKDEKVGEIKDFLVDPKTGTISTLVLGVGGFLGMGEKNVAVPFSEVKMTTRNNRAWLTIDTTKDALKAAPAFVRTTDASRPMNDTAGKPVTDPAKPLNDTAVSPLNDAAKPMNNTAGKPVTDPAKPMNDTAAKPLADPAKPMSDTAVAPLNDPAKPMNNTATMPLNDPAKPVPTTKPVPDTMQKPATQDATAPVAGANSFTEAQARTRIESMGYTNVSGLSKDNQGVWHGTAMKDGKQVNVAADFKGNVVAQ